MTSREIEQPSSRIRHLGFRDCNKTLENHKKMYQKYSKSIKKAEFIKKKHVTAVKS